MEELLNLRRLGWRYPEDNEIMHLKSGKEKVLGRNYTPKIPNAIVNEFHSEVADESMRSYVCHEFAEWLLHKADDFDYERAF